MCSLMSLTKVLKDQVERFRLRFRDTLRRQVDAKGTHGGAMRGNHVGRREVHNGTSFSCTILQHQTRAMCELLGTSTRQRRTISNLLLLSLYIHAGLRGGTQICHGRPAQQYDGNSV